jgi:hypothetical protein
MSSTSTQTVEVHHERPSEDHSTSSAEPVSDVKSKKPRFSITIVSQVPG